MHIFLSSPPNIFVLILVKNTEEPFSHVIRGPHGGLAITCTYFVCAKCSYPQKIKAILTYLCSLIRLRTFYFGSIEGETIIKSY